MATERVKDEQTWQDFFINTRGQKISCKYWYPVLDKNEPISKAVFIMHGLAEHCRAYERIAASLVKSGMLVCGHDHVGHGMSDGDRVHIDDFNYFIIDTIQQVDMIKKRYPNITCYGLGHSMGGAVTLKAVLDHPTVFKGVAMIAPAVKPDPAQATPFKVGMGRVVAAVSPQCPVSKVDPHWVSRDPAAVQRYIDDPLVYHGSLKAKFTILVLDAMTEIQNRVEEIKTPFFVIHGDHDKLCMLEGSQFLYQKASSQDKRIKIFPAAYHQVHTEPEGQAEECIADVTDWLSKH